MKEYILSILGIVLIGLIIDIIMPSGNINKYIKSLYSIFVVAIIVSPLLKIIKTGKNFEIKYDSFEMSSSFLKYFGSRQAEELETKIVSSLESEGLNNVNVKLNYEIVDDKTTFNSCEIDIRNMAISLDKQHIDKYEFIIQIVQEITGLEKEVIIFND